MALGPVFKKSFLMSACTPSFDASALARFEPKDDTTRWLRDEPLDAPEVFVPDHHTNRPAANAFLHRDAGLGYPEFRDAAFGLGVRSLGTYRADAIDDVDPCFVASPAGHERACRN